MSSEVAEELSKQTRALIERFEVRANAFHNRRDLARLTVPLDVPAADALARDLFGDGEHVATGIDGSMDFDERLQMMLFYSNATAYSCPFTVGERLEFDLDSASRESRMAASAAVPLWAEDVVDVMPDTHEMDIELERSLEKIPNAFMTLGELYLGVLSVARSSVVFLDRPLSGTYSALAADARRLRRMGASRLTKWSRGAVSFSDLTLALALGSPTAELPRRGRFLQAVVTQELMKGPKTPTELAGSLGVSVAQAERAIRSLEKTDARFGGSLLRRDGSSLAVAEGVSGYWDRVAELALAFAKTAFSGRKHPLAVSEEEYLTILDVNTVSLVLLELLCERARKSGTLVIGVAKDTAATDVTRAVLPLAAREGAVTLASPPPRLKNDKTFLAILSAENPFILTPWRTRGYDSACSTIVELNGQLRSARKFVSRERLFVRSYFQLRSLKSDPTVRSPVFLFDRPYDERYDSPSVRRLAVEERSGPTEVGLYFEGAARSPLSNLVLRILSLNDNPEVFEAFGHNQLLYLADKAVKAEVRLLRGSLRAVADLRVAGVSSRRRIFGLVTSYREERAEAEQARGRSARGRR